MFKDKLSVYIYPLCTFIKQDTKENKEMCSFKDHVRICPADQHGIRMQEALIVKIS